MTSVPVSSRPSRPAAARRTAPDLRRAHLRHAAAAVRAVVSAREADGRVWLVFLGDRGVPLLVRRTRDLLRGLDPLHVRDLAAMTAVVRDVLVAVVVHRASGQARAVDRRLVAALAAAMGSEADRLLGVAVVGVAAVGPGGRPGARAGPARDGPATHVRPARENPTARDGPTVCFPLR